MKFIQRAAGSESLSFAPSLYKTGSLAGDGSAFADTDRVIVKGAEGDSQSEASPLLTERVESNVNTRGVLRLMFQVSVGALVPNTSGAGCCCESSGTQPFTAGDQSITAHMVVTVPSMARKSLSGQNGPQAQTVAINQVISTVGRLLALFASTPAGDSSSDPGKPALLKITCLDISGDERIAAINVSQDSDRRTVIPMDTPSDELLHFYGVKFDPESGTRTLAPCAKVGVGDSAFLVAAAQGYNPIARMETISA